MLQAIIDIVASATFRRLAVTGIGLAIPYLNKKFGWNIDSTQVIGILGLVVAYLAQSVTNEMHARTAGVEAAAKINTVDDALAIINNTKPPTVAPVTVNVGAPPVIVPPVKP